MEQTLLEKLPNEQALYRVYSANKIKAGQWLESEDRRFPVFAYTEHFAQLIAPINTLFSEQLVVGGKAIDIADESSKLLLVADNQAIPILLFLINQLITNWGVKKLNSRIFQILLASDGGFPFNPVPSRFIIPNMPAGTIANAQLLEDLGIPARLASSEELPGCFPGSLPQLIEQFDYTDFIKQQSTVVAIGSTPLLKCIKKLFTTSHCKQFLSRF